MNIAFINATKIWSGPKTWMLEFGTELRAMGERVSYLVSDPVFEAELRRRDHEVLGLRFGCDYNPVAIARCHAYFRERRIAVTCMNIQKELRTAGIAARLAGIPVIQRVGSVHDLNDKWDQRLTRRWVVDRFLVPSGTMKKDLLARRHDLRDADIAVVHNAKPAVAAPRAGMGRPVRLVLVSRLQTEKRQGDLVEALGRLSGEIGRELPPLEADLYGDGETRAELQAQIDSAGLGERVRLRGFHRDVPSVLPGYDFGLLTSSNEGLPNVVLEYLAAGLPVISTDVGGVGEVMREGEEGFLYRPGDIGALTGVLRRCLLLTDAAYAALSRNALRRMEAQFHPRRQAEQLRDLFQARIDRRSGGAAPSD